MFSSAAGPSEEPATPGSALTQPPPLLTALSAPPALHAASRRAVASVPSPLQSSFTLAHAEEAPQPPAAADPMPVPPENPVVARALADVPALAFDDAAPEAPWQVQFSLVMSPGSSASATARMGADSLQASVQGPASLRAELSKGSLLPSPPQAAHTTPAAHPPALADPPAAFQVPALHDPLAGPALSEAAIRSLELGKADAGSYAFLVAKRSSWGASWTALLSAYLAHELAKPPSGKLPSTGDVSQPDCVGYWIKNGRKWRMRPGNRVEPRHAEIMGSWWNALVAVDDGYAALNVGGPNGVCCVVAGLVYIRAELDVSRPADANEMQARQARSAGAVEQWEALNGDVARVLRAMACTVEAAPTAKRKVPSQLLPPSSAKRRRPWCVALFVRLASMLTNAAVPRRLSSSFLPAPPRPVCGPRHAPSAPRYFIWTVVLPIQPGSKY
jgi:hypothetical protein